VKLRRHFQYQGGEWLCTLTLPARQAHGRGRTKAAAYAEAYRQLYGGFTPIPAWTLPGRVQLIG